MTFFWGPKKDLNIIYNGIGINKKIKYISWYLLLKKIVIDWASSLKQYIINI